MCPANLIVDRVDGTTPSVAAIDVGSITASGHTGNNVVAFGVLSVGSSATFLNGIVLTFTAANGYLQSFTALNLPGSSGDPTPF